MSTNMDRFCLILGYAFVMGMTLVGLSLFWWWVLNRIVRVIDPTREFVAFCFERIKQRREKEEQP